MNSRHVLIALSIFVLGGTLFAAEEVRTWTDNTGNYTFEASYVSSNGTQVKIKNTDGKVLTLSLDKLSEEDQDYVKGLAKENPFAAAMRSAGSGSEDDSASSSGSGGGKAKILRINLNSVVDMGDYGDSEWSCEPDPSPTPKYPGRPKRLHFRLMNIPFGVFADSTGYYFSPKDGTTVHTAVVLAALNNDWKKVTRLYFGDVNTGKTHFIDQPNKLYPYGFAPDGKRLMFKQDAWDKGGWGKMRKMHIVSYENGKITPLYSFEPFGQVPAKDSGFNREKDIEWAAWVDDDHILVLSGNNRLVLISLSKAKAIWRITTDHSAKISLSPGGKYCIVPTSNNSCLFIETLSGETIGQLEGANSAMARRPFAFSPDGKKIVSCDADMVRIWEANTGKAYEPFFIKGASSNSRIVWTNNRSFLIGNTLIDPVNKAPMWEYQINHGGDDALYNVGGCVWYANKVHNEGYVLNGVVLPHPKVKPADGSVADADLYLLYPGMDVSLKIDGSISKDRAEVERIITEKIRENGWDIKNGAPFTFVLKQSKEPEKKVTYGIGMGFGGFGPLRGGGTEVTVRPERYTIQLQKGGNTLWEEYMITSSPNNINIDDVNKSSLQEIVNREMAKNSYKNWIGRVRVPKKILDPTKIGRSELTEMGIKDLDR